MMVMGTSTSNSKLSSDIHLRSFCQRSTQSDFITIFVVHPLTLLNLMNQSGGYQGMLYGHPRNYCHFSIIHIHLHVTTLVLQYIQLFTLFFTSLPAIYDIRFRSLSLPFPNPSFNLGRNRLLVFDIIDDNITQPSSRIIIHQLFSLYGSTHY